MSPAAKKKAELMPVASIQAEAVSRIFTVRGQRVVLDSDLAEFYGVRTYDVTRAVLERNPERFPSDFVFRLTAKEWAALKPQNGASKRSRGGRQTVPLAFTEQGALALSAVLKGERAAEVSVAVARAFVAMRDQLAQLRSHPLLVEFAERLTKLERHSTRQTEFNQLMRDAMRNFDSFIELVEGELPEAP